MRMGNIIDTLTGKVTSNALDTAAERPFKVTLALEPDTQAWASVLVLGVLAALFIMRRK